MKRWRIMEELENIFLNQPVFPGNIISKDYLKSLTKAKLVMRNSSGDVILSPGGWKLMHLWNRLPNGSYLRKRRRGFGN